VGFGANGGSQGAQHRRQLCAAHLARHPQRLDDAVCDGIGEGDLESFRAGIEVAGGMDVARETVEGGPQRLGRVRPQARDGVGEPRTRSHRGDEVIADIGPQGTSRTRQPSAPRTQPQHRS
jgi:hypothetical protein